MNLGQRLHDETGVVVVDKIAHSIHRVIPRTVLILILQNKIQISLGNSPVIVIREHAVSASQEKGTISGGVDNSALTEWAVGTTAGSFRRSEILNISTHMSNNRFDYPSPLFSRVDLKNLQKGLINIGRAGDQRCLLFEHPPAPNPVKRIAPAILLEIAATRG